MGLTVTPRSFRTTPLDRLDHSGILRTPPRNSQQRQETGGRRRKGEHVLIENCSLLGRFLDPVDIDVSRNVNRTVTKGTTGRYAGENGLGSGNSRSFVMDFIDQCVANNVPESLIVEHVLFMIDTMQEQISMTEAMHARFQHDRLREYEISELTNMIERQQAYYNHRQQHQEQQANLRTRNVEREIINERMRQNQIPLFSNTLNDGYLLGSVTSQGNKMMGSVEAHTTRHTGQSSLSTNRGRVARVAFTQTPREERRMETSRGSRGTAATTTFRHFMCPTDTSNRKERPKCTSVRGGPQRNLRSQEGSVYTEASSRRAARQGPPTKRATTATEAARTASAAWRGRQRLLEGTGINFIGSSTWSDDDSPLPGKYCGDVSNFREATQEEQQPPPPRSRQRGCTSPSRVVSTGLMHPLPPPQREGTEAEVLAHEIHSVKGDKTLTTRMDVLNAASNLPLTTILSVPNTSLYPSPQLQAYIEQSERKVREADRVLASIPGSTRDFHQGGRRGMTLSPLSVRVSELSDD